MRKWRYVALSVLLLAPVDWQWAPETTTLLSVAR